MLYYHSKNRWF